MHDIHHGVFTKSRKSQSLKLGNLLEPTEEEPFFTTYIAQSSFKSSCIMIRVELEGVGESTKISMQLIVV